MTMRAIRSDLQRATIRQRSSEGASKPRMDGRRRFRIPSVASARLGRGSERRRARRRKSPSLSPGSRSKGELYADRQDTHWGPAGPARDRCGGAGRRARRHQEARHAHRRREGGLQAVRLPRAVRRHHRPRAGPRRRRRQEARRQAGAGAGRLRQPHGVPQSGQDRPDDRDHVGQARSPQGRAGDRAALLLRRRQHPAQEGCAGEELGQTSRARSCAAPPAPSTTRTSPSSTDPRSPPSTARRSRCWRSRTATASATSTTRPSSSAS